MGVIAILSAFLTIMPQTFLLGSVMGGGVVYFIAALQCRQHNLRGALIEIPFLLLPLVLLWVSHPIGRDCQRMQLCRRSLGYPVTDASWLTKTSPRPIAGVVGSPFEWTSSQPCVKRIVTINIIYLSYLRLSRVFFDETRRY
jgi:hypothetical protein